LGRTSSSKCIMGAKISIKMIKDEMQLISIVEK